MLKVLERSLADQSIDPSAENGVRYKLIIDSSQDESLISLLFSFGILKRKKTRIYVSSKFWCDSESKKVNYYDNINHGYFINDCLQFDVIAAVKHSASQGHTVLLSLDSDLYESFHDMFNQRFTCIENSVKRERPGNQADIKKRFYTRVVVGSYVQPCLIHAKFQCVVIVKKADLSCTPSAFLDQFEKYALSHSILLESVLKSLPVPVKKLVTKAHDKVHIDWL